MDRQDIEEALLGRGMKLDSRGKLTTVMVFGELVEVKASKIAKRVVNTGNLAGLLSLVDYARHRAQTDKEWQKIDIGAIEAFLNRLKTE